MSEYQTVILDSLAITKTTQWIPVNIRKKRKKMLVCIPCMWAVTSKSFCFRHAYTSMPVHVTAVWKFTSALEWSFRSLKTMQEITHPDPFMFKAGFPGAALLATYRAGLRRKWESLRTTTRKSSATDGYPPGRKHRLYCLVSQGQGRGPPIPPDCFFRGLLRHL